MNGEFYGFSRALLQRIGPLIETTVGLVCWELTLRGLGRVISFGSIFSCLKIRFIHATASELSPQLHTGTRGIFYVSPRTHSRDMRRNVRYFRMPHRVDRTLER